MQSLRGRFASLRQEHKEKKILEQQSIQGQHSDVQQGVQMEAVRPEFLGPQLPSRAQSEIDAYTDCGSIMGVKGEYVWDSNIKQYRSKSGRFAGVNPSSMEMGVSASKLEQSASLAKEG